MDISGLLKPVMNERQVYSLCHFPISIKATDIHMGNLLKTKLSPIYKKTEQISVPSFLKFMPSSRPFSFHPGYGNADGKLSVPRQDHSLI